MMDNHLQHTSADGSAHHYHPDSKSSTTAPVDRPTFTFIDQDDDLTSKRIKDVKARKAIRSHVMRDVRRRERLAGLKRGAKGRSEQPEIGGLSMRPKEYPTTSPSSASSTLPETEPKSGSELEAVHDLIKPELERRCRPARWSAGYSTPENPSPSPRFLPTSWIIDPFCTLPGSHEAPAVISHLLFYWKTVFVPMTFPIEQKVSQRAEMELMVKSAFSDPGSFFGLMTMCAAHRAILNGRHSDLTGPSHNSFRTLDDVDYYVMKAKCIHDMNVKLLDRDRSLSDEAFDTMVNLLTSALIVGVFGEARIHLGGLKVMVELRGGIAEDSIRRSSMLAAILTTDVKAATGLMAKPVFPLTWDSQPVPTDIQQRVKPSESSPLNRLGGALFANDLLSLPLLRILHVLRDIVFFSQAHKYNPTILNPADHDFFRVLNCEVEHQLLSYIYPEHEKGKGSFPGKTFNLHTIEATARVASICYLNHFLIVSPPSCGLGRALTRHLKEVLNGCTLPLISQLPPENYGLLAWASFIGAQGSIGQVEYPWFVERLTRVAMICGWRSWPQVSDIMSEYVYVPNANEVIWKPIWDEAMAGLVPDVIGF